MKGITKIKERLKQKLKLQLKQTILKNGKMYKIWNIAQRPSVDSHY
jgi:hypothetical protein